MKLKICGKEQLERLAETPFAERVALISISDSDDRSPTLKNKPEFVLELHFDDITLAEFNELREADKKGYKLIADKQARQIAEFVNGVKDKADVIICQCMYGQSRSAAVAAAISEHFFRKGIDIFSNEKYLPNKTVYHKVMKALKGNKLT